MPLLPLSIAGPLPAQDRDALRRALDATPTGAPVVVMIHGFRFASGRGNRCPHRHILALHPDSRDPKAISWPRHLGLGREGLGIAFGWQATGTIWGAYGRAARAGEALAQICAEGRIAGHSMQVVAHSLGARVALQALHHADAGDITRMILMTAADLQRPTLAAMNSRAGQAVEVLNVSSRENDMFDFMLETLIAGGTDSALGFGLCKLMTNWTDLQLDAPADLAALGQLGHRIPEPDRRICHWSPYLRPGTFPLYRAILSGALPIAMLRSALPQTKSPRWSRLLQLAAPHAPLPPGLNASS